jgi:hypothetical protein
VGAYLAELEALCRTAQGPSRQGGSLRETRQALRGNWYLCRQSGTALIEKLGLYPKTLGLSLVLSNGPDYPESSELEGSWHVIGEAQPGRLRRLRGACGRAAVRGELSFRFEVLETEYRTVEYEIRPPRPVPAPMPGAPRPALPEPRVIETRTVEGAVPPPSATPARSGATGPPMPLRAPLSTTVRRTLVIPSRWNLAVEATPRTTTGTAVRMPVALSQSATRLELGDARLVKLDRLLIPTEADPRPKPEPHEVPPVYEHIVNLLRWRPDAVLEVVKVDQCRPRFRGRRRFRLGAGPGQSTRRKKTGPEECRIVLKVVRVLGGKPAWRGLVMQKRVLKRCHSWAKAPGVRVLGSVVRQCQGGHWIDGHVYDDPKLVAVAEKLGRGLARGQRVPDLTGEIEPHPLLESFRKAPGLAHVVLGLESDWRWSEDGCLQAVPMVVIEAYRGPLAEQETAMLLPARAAVPLDRSIVAYESRPDGALLVGQWAATADAKALAMMVTGTVPPTSRPSRPTGSRHGRACVRRPRTQCR